MGTNQFLNFCNTDTGTNLPSQVDYAADPNRDIGNSPGIASSKLNNKPVRQATAITSQVAQYMANKTNINVLDDGNMATLLGQMYSTFAPQNSSAIENLTLAATVSSGALTIAVKTQMGNDASSTDQIFVGMRSATVASGLYNRRTITSALSLVISSGSTLGQVNSQASRIWVYLIDNAGTLELAASHAYYKESAVVTTVAEGGAGAADSATDIYSTTARSNVPLRLIGYLDNTQATAGTWATAPSTVQLLPSNNWIAPTVQRFTSGSGTYYTPAGVKYIRVTCVGGGGGGGGGSNNLNDGGSGTAGSSTTFGTLTAAGGGRGPGTAIFGSAFSNADAPGAPSVGAGFTDAGSSTGVRGGSNFLAGASGAIGGFGGAGPLGGGGGAPGVAGVANSGGGGGGGSTFASTGASAPGGSSGAVVRAINTSLAASYSYAVGSGGNAGTAGTNGGAGAAGGSGVVIVEEYYS